MWYNRIISWLLSSPLHGLLSENVMLIRVTGRKSGRIYTTPVNYVRDGGIRWVTSFRNRTWWRNLKGGAPVSVLLAGKELSGQGQAIVDAEDVAESLRGFFQKVSGRAKYFGVRLDPEGRPDAQDCSRAAQEHVIIRIELQ
jgi:hypothetical protein